jgi:hypothetical protein
MYNQLTELDVTTCPELMYLLCEDNQLTELDISRNSKLLYLWCRYNLLTSVDLSTCPDNFLSLDIRGDQVAGTIDVSRFASLLHLMCTNNQISQVVLGNHDDLIYLLLDFNQLTSIDARGCSALQIFRTQNNQLTSLQLGNSPDLNLLALFYNELNASQMGQIVNALPTRSADDPGTLYAIVDYNPEDDILEGNVITSAQVSQANAKNWDVYHWSWAEDEGWEPYTGSSFIRGDVNGDGHVTIGDVSALIDYLLSNDASGINLDGADVNGDGHVTIGDVSALIDMLLSGTASVMKSHNVHSASVSFPGLVPNDELVLEKPRRIKK